MKTGDKVQQLMWDLVVYGCCYIDENSERVDPRLVVFEGEEMKTVVHAVNKCSVCKKTSIKESKH